MFESEWAQEDCSEAASAHTGYFIPRVFWGTNLEYILQRFQPRHHVFLFNEKGQRILQQRILPVASGTSLAMSYCHKPG